MHVSGQIICHKSLYHLNFGVDIKLKNSLLQTDNRIYFIMDILSIHQGNEARTINVNDKNVGKIIVISHESLL